MSGSTGPSDQTVPTTTLRPGDVVRYDTLTRPNRWCREGTAIVHDDGRATDTFWSGGSEVHVLTAEETATAVVVFNLGDFYELAHRQHHKWLDYHPDDRQVVTSQHGLCRRLFVRIGAEPDHGTKVQNAAEAVEEAERAVRSAEQTLSWRRRELDALIAGTPS